MLFDNKTMKFSMQKPYMHLYSTSFHILYSDRNKTNLVYIYNIIYIGVPECAFEYGEKVNIL